MHRDDWLIWRSRWRTGSEEGDDAVVVVGVRKIHLSWERLAG